MIYHLVNSIKNQRVNWLGEANLTGMGWATGWIDSFFLSFIVEERTGWYGVNYKKVNRWRTHLECGKKFNLLWFLYVYDWIDMLEDYEKQWSM